MSSEMDRGGLWGRNEEEGYDTVIIYSVVEGFFKGSFGVT